MQRALLDAQMAQTQDGAPHTDQTARLVAQRFNSWRALAKQRARIEADASDVLIERERLAWQVGELDKLSLKPGEWAEVCHEHSRLSHAASLLEGAQETLAALSESDHPMLSQLAALNQKLGKLVAIDAGLQDVLDCMEPARIQLQEAVYALGDYLDKIELDPERLRQVEARMEVLHGAARKFRVAPEQLPDEYASLSAKLLQLADASDLEGLRRQEQECEAHYLEAAARLSDARRQAAARLSSQVSAAMQELSMTGGSFCVALNACDPSAAGVEHIEFLVAGHAGVAPRPLAKVASGGELARIALAISVITSSATTTPTLIFDEVDSGIGGAVAEVVGRLLKRLGQQRQVLCVTHLPQVASQANWHFQVIKGSLEDGKTVSRIDALDSKARVEEVARMLGGVEITATTRKHARELLAS